MSFKITKLAIRYHLDAQKSNTANFLAAVAGMSINNFLFLYSLWLMLFDGKEQNRELFPYFLALWSISAFSWGVLSVGARGLFWLGTMIEEGSLEPTLGVPRRPLFLAAISRSDPSGLGDMIQAALTWILIYHLTDFGYLVKVWGATLVVGLGFYSVLVAGGTLAFFLDRGAALGSFIAEAVLCLSIYPSGKMMDGRSRWLLYLTPALLTSYLQMVAIESASLATWFLALGASLFAASAASAFFSFGVRSYKTSSFTGARVN